jgi:hypothetical protein
MGPRTRRENSFCLVKARKSPPKRAGCASSIGGFSLPTAWAALMRGGRSLRPGESRKCPKASRASAWSTLRRNAAGAGCHWVARGGGVGRRSCRRRKRLARSAPMIPPALARALAELLCDPAPARQAGSPGDADRAARLFDWSVIGPAAARGVPIRSQREEALMSAERASPSFRLQAPRRKPARRVWLITRARVGTNWNGFAPLCRGDGCSMLAAGRLPHFDAMRGLVEEYWALDHPSGAALFAEPASAPKASGLSGADAERLPFADATFDSALVLEVFEHLPPPLAALG